MNLCKVIAKGIILGCILSLGMFTTVFAYETKGVVSGENVNLRREASTASDVIKKIEGGQVLSISGKEGGFFKTEIDGQKAYIASEYVKISQTSAEVNGTNVNIRQSPSTSAPVLARVNTGDQLLVLDCEGDWLKVNMNGMDGYVRNDFASGWAVSYFNKVSVPAGESFVKTNLSIDEKNNDQAYALVKASGGLRLRELPTKEANTLNIINNGVAVDVLSIEGDWVKASYDGIEGYLSADFLSIGYGNKPDKNTASTNLNAQEIIEYGKRFLGTPYVYAGNNLSSGVDCSGFVYNVYKDFGLALNRSSRDMVKDGPKVSKSELQPGDLVFFDTNGGSNQGNISHVGIYMGDDKFIHSSSSKRTWGVVISSLNEEYYQNTYVSACRVL